MSDALIKLILFDIRKEIEDVENFIKDMNENQFLSDIILLLKKIQKSSGIK